MSSDRELNLLCKAAADIEGSRFDAARLHLDELLASLDSEYNSRNILCMLHVRAFARLITDETGRELNLYLRDFEEPHIDLFNIVAARLPLASLAGRIANAHLVRALHGVQEGTLLSIGMGTGQQEVALLNEIASSDGDFQKLTIIGIDPVCESLRSAEELIRKASQRLRIKVDFRPIVSTVESMDEKAWLQLESLPRPLLVNAAFSLHHIQELPPNNDERGVFLRRLHRLGPAAVVMCEPDSDHHRTDLASRLLASWSHFGTVFDMIDHLKLEEHERIAIMMFFGREICDILGTMHDGGRFERHERTETWLQRLILCGYHLPKLVSEDYPSHPDVSVAEIPGALVLGFRGEPAVSVICASASHEGAAI